MSNFGETWTCHICGKERPDAQISVRRRDVSLEYKLPAGTVVYNIRYCNDDPSCLAGASLPTATPGLKREARHAE